MPETIIREGMERHLTRHEQHILDSDQALSEANDLKQFLVKREIVSPFFIGVSNEPPITQYAEYIMDRLLVDLLTRVAKVDDNQRNSDAHHQP